MLQPAAITSLLNQLINDSNHNTDTVRPHTAILTLLESSELYAVATRLVHSPTPRSAVASILASTAAATGTAPPPASAHNGICLGNSAPLTLDERAACLSAMAVAAWRQATEASPQSKGGRGASNVVIAGTWVGVAKHAVTGMASSKGSSPELVPLLLESDLGRMLVMPIVPAAPALSQSRSEMAAMEGEHGDELQAYSGMEQQKAFMLLTLNASLDPAPVQQLPKDASTPNATPRPALACSTAALSANNPARSRLKSGGTTPTSTRSDNTATPSRSPVSDHLPTGLGGPHSTSSQLLPRSSDREIGSGKSTPACIGAGVEEEWEAKLWSGLYAQAKALARVLAPSLTKCGVGQQHHTDDHHGGEAREGRQSGVVSDDDA
ncbi:uncharacterized protein UDID_06013 [Ustilago sp. UG-2017a]|nr:uncharacterized protein UDID_06013 [Ustilago sp. UG-2017a]